MHTFIITYHIQCMNRDDGILAISLMDAKKMGKIVVQDRIDSMNKGNLKNVRYLYSSSKTSGSREKNHITASAMQKPDRAKYYTLVSYTEGEMLIKIRAADREEAMVVGRARLRALMKNTGDFENPKVTGITVQMI